MYTALVVEDDPDWQDPIVEILSQMECKATIASTYNEAREALAGPPFDLIVADINLVPHSTGNVDGARFIHYLEETKRIIPVIIVSGTFPPQDLSRLPGRIIDIIKKQEFTSERFVRDVKQSLNFPLIAL